jgi:hypothetical protein
MAKQEYYVLDLIHQVREKMLKGVEVDDVWSSILEQQMKSDCW